MRIITVLMLLIVIEVSLSMLPSPPHTRETELLDSTQKDHFTFSQYRNILWYHFPKSVS